MKDINKKRKIKIDSSHLNYLIAIWLGSFFAIIAILSASLYGIRLSRSSLILISVTQILVTFATVYIAVCYFPIRKVFKDRLPRIVTKFQLISMFIFLSLAAVFIVNAFLIQPLWTNYFKFINDSQQQENALKYLNILKVEMIVLMSSYLVLILVNAIMFTKYFTGVKYWESE
ncbi:hypothetical protein HGG64_02430 [Mycoplasma phocoeninasale]|uniref:Uncharacterized protein n=1 Tax=Mycoplasma phocoeninasale TaxID=2726117 RepID=A0A858U748_9MOLU|nr:hypothetical protein [Mycoplasma phocoeninasale]QJG66546.1 hypothetical protein HGG64_02430 [Mycoplasma phocoeninasale]